MATDPPCAISLYEGRDACEVTAADRRFAADEGEFKLFAPLLLLLVSAQTGGVGPIEVTATTIDIAGAGHKATLPCKGRAVVVAGSGHVVRLTGTCAAIDISGAGNKVSVNLAPGGALAVAGSDQDVRYFSSGEIRHDVSGADNRVERADTPLD